MHNTKLKNMEQQNYQTITQTSEDTIICDGKIFWTRIGYGKMLGLSSQSLGTPYAHVRAGKAAHMTFMGLSFFRVI